MSAASFDDVVASSLESLSQAPEDLTLDVPVDLPPALADPALLERAVANIITNAVRWSPPHRPIRVQGACVGDTVVLRIVDSGPGIPPSDRQRVLRPFQRLGDQTHGRGVGLGLAVAYGFVTAMRGELLLEDTPGGGLTVQISLPVAAAEVDDVPGPLHRHESGDESSDAISAACEATR